MGTHSFTVGRYARSSDNILGTHLRTSDQHASTTAASNVTDGGGAISLEVGDVYVCHHDEDAWINFGGNAATVGDGFFLPSGQQREFECTVAGAVSIIDVA